MFLISNTGNTPPTVPPKALIETVSILSTVGLVLD